MLYPKKYLNTSNYFGLVVKIEDDKVFRYRYKIKWWVRHTYRSFFSHDHEAFIKEHYTSPDESFKFPF